MPDEKPERVPAPGRPAGPSDPGETGGFGRWKPTIHWYTPILLLLGGLGVLGLLFVIVRRMARDAEEDSWGEDLHLREHHDEPRGRKSHPDDPGTA